MINLSIEDRAVLCALIDVVMALHGPPSSTTMAEIGLLYARLKHEGVTA